MTTTILKNECMEQFGRLPADLQLQALQFIRVLGASKQPSGTSGKSLASFAGCIPADDLQQISKSIQKGCEQQILYYTNTGERYEYRQKKDR
jgi:hypothetical protein